MTESSLSLSDLKVALKRHGLHYKLKKGGIDGKFGEKLHFLDCDRGVQTSGKIVQFFTEGEAFHWPLLSHENIAPLIDIVFLQDNLSLFITIDLEVTLKKIIHEEDFVHDPGCFERKKSYARGIFNGLSYLHGKSLCLMNLSDTNVVICKMYDQAIISDFSSLGCSRIMDKSKLNVPVLYRAPEWEKKDFDATAAEIWAAGVLMLDMFLAHMAPWAIVDYKTSRVIKLVDKLSCELLQAANIGSVVSMTDLTKFKTFLKCFFRDFPLARVTAKNASIASFLRPKSNDTALYSSPTATLMQLSSGFEGENMDKYFVSNSSLNCQYTGAFSDKSDRNDMGPINQTKRQYIENTSSELSYRRKDLTGCSQIRRASSPARNPPQLGNESKNSDIGQDIGVRAVSAISSRFTAKTQDVKGISSTELPSLQGLTAKYDYSRRMHTSIPNLNEISEHNKSSTLGDVPCSQINYACYQSKSLSLMKNRDAEARNEFSFRYQFSRSCSCSQVKSLLIPEVNDDDERKSDLCLDRLFSAGEPAEDPNDSNSATETAAEDLDATIGGDFQENKQEVLDRNCSNGIIPTIEEIKKNIASSRKLNDDAKMNPSVQDIMKNLSVLSQLLKSLKNQPVLRISEEFESKQRNIQREYKLLLIREKIRLCEILRRTFGINITRRQNAPPIQGNILGTGAALERGSRLYDSKLIVRRQHAVKEKFRIIAEGKSNNNQLKKPGISRTPNFRSHRNYSYRKAILSEVKEPVRSPHKVATDEEWPVYPKKSESKDKLIKKNNKSVTATKKESGKKKKSKRSKKKVDELEMKRGNQAAVRGRSPKKSASKGKETRVKAVAVAEPPENRSRGEEPRRSSFFFSLCPGGRVESTQTLESLCETCKLQLNQ